MGREVIPLIKDINKIEKQWNIIGFFDDDPKKERMINGFPVLGGIAELNSWPTELCLAISIGRPATKRNIIKRINNPKISFPTLIHPSVIIGEREHVSIGKGTIICAGTIITTNVKIGDFVLFNLSCTITHDDIISDYCSLMPSVCISGEDVLGRGVYVGTGAKIINGINVGENVTIGAGAVVIKDLPPNCTAVGVPALPVHFLSKYNDNQE